MKKIEQLSPDFRTTQAEDELICEKLLRWKRAQSCGAQEWYDDPYGDDGAQWHTVYTPSFDHWADAGLILDAFAPLGGSVVMYVPHHEHHWSCSPPGGRDVAVIDGDTGPEAIRAAALEYIRSLP